MKNKLELQEHVNGRKIELFKEKEQTKKTLSEMIEDKDTKSAEKSSSKKLEKN